MGQRHILNFLEGKTEEVFLFFFYIWRTITGPKVVNLMCQLDWARWCPDIWSDTILGVSVRLFLGESNL